MPKIQLPAGLTQDALRLMVNAQYTASFNTVNRKRMTFRERDKYYNDQYKTELVDMKILSAVHTTMLSLMKVNGRTVRFSPTSIFGTIYARDMEKVSERLYNKMEADESYSFVLDNKLKYGVGLRIMVGTDPVNDLPMWRRMDTRLWVPDPQGGYGKKFRWEGFEEEVSYAELKNMGVDNLQYVQDASMPSGEVQLMKVVSYSSSGLNAPSDVMKSDRGRMVSIYHHFFERNGKKFYSLWSSGRSVLHMLVEIKPVFADEKKDPSRIKFPIAHNYFQPKTNDPFGVSLTEQMIDKHIAQNILFNLMLYREKNVALGDDVIFDSRAGLDRRILAQPTMGQRFIPGDGQRIGGIQNALVAIPKNSTPQSVVNAFEMLGRAIETSTTIDARQMGISGSRPVTLGEANQLQSNNNLRSLYYDDVNNSGEKEFWHITFRCMAENMEADNKLLIRVASETAPQTFSYMRKDIVGDTLPEIEIISQVQHKEKMDSDRTQIMPLLMNKLASPDLSPAKKAMIERRVYLMLGMKREDAKSLSGMSVEESDAMNKLLLLNNNDFDGAIVDREDVDHEVYIEVFEMGLPTEARAAAIAARKKVMLEMGFNKANVKSQMLGMQQGGAGATQQQMASQAMNQFSNEATQANADMAGTVTRGQGR